MVGLLQEVTFHTCFFCKAVFLALIPISSFSGVYCCGPCPVKAVRDGDVGMKYDAAFVFSEVNANLVTWIVYPDGQRSQVSLNQKTVGRNISTKSVYGDYREDITKHYKYPEGIHFLPLNKHTVMFTPAQILAQMGREPKEYSK